MQETRNCQNCKSQFVIEPGDFDFYNKIRVPAPSWCPKCRQQRRYSWRNERILYRRDCASCSKSMVSIYSLGKPFKVFCSSCWWGDGWDGKDYGRDFDFSRPFFEQFRELQKVVPRMCLRSKNNVNSEYTNHSSNNKDCYLTQVCFGSEGVLYSNSILNSKDSSDLLYIIGGKVEKSYECIDSRDCYHCQFGVKIRDCLDCFYCFDCRGCSNCFLSFNLRQKNYCFLNEQLTKEAYEEKIKQYNLGSYSVRCELYERFVELVNKKAIHKTIMIEKSENCSGDMVSNSRDVLNCFNADESENCHHCITLSKNKDSFDTYHSGWSGLIYESHAISGSASTLFSHYSYDNTDIMYCDSCDDCNHLFGCIGMKKSNYCILNKQYSEG